MRVVLLNSDPADVYWRPELIDAGRCDGSTIEGLKHWHSTGIMDGLIQVYPLIDPAGPVEILALMIDNAAPLPLNTIQAGVGKITDLADADPTRSNFPVLTGKFKVGVQGVGPLFNLVPKEVRSK